MSLVDAFAKEDRTEVKFSQFFALVKQAAQYETLMNKVFSFTVLVMGISKPTKYIFIF